MSRVRCIIPACLVITACWACRATTGSKVKLGGTIGVERATGFEQKIAMPIIAIEPKSGKIQGPATIVPISKRVALTAAHVAAMTAFDAKAVLSLRGDLYLANRDRKTGPFGFLKRDLPVAIKELGPIPDVVYFPGTTASDFAAGAQIGSDIIYKDLAIIKFKEDVFEQWVKVYPRKMQKGNPVVLAGYGFTIVRGDDGQFYQGTRGVAHIGTNVIYSENSNYDRSLTIQGLQLDGRRYGAGETAEEYAQRRAFGDALLRGGDSGSGILVNIPKAGDASPVLYLGATHCRGDQITDSGQVSQGSTTIERRLDDEATLQFIRDNAGDEAIASDAELGTMTPQFYKIQSPNDDGPSTLTQDEEAQVEQGDAKDDASPFIDSANRAPAKASGSAGEQGGSSSDSRPRGR